MANGWEELNAVGRLALFGVAFAGATACTYLTDDGVLPPLMDTELPLALPEHCEANRTLSGYTVTCDPVPGQEGSLGDYHADAGYVDTLESLEGLLMDTVPVAMGESWEELRTAWQDQVQATLSAPLREVSGEDRAHSQRSIAP
jgi:hypothetical protein